MALARNTTHRPRLAVVGECAGDLVAVFQEPNNRALHVNRNALVNAVILKRADHLEPRAVADVGQSRIFVSAEVALENLAVRGAIEDRAPRFELAHAVGCFARVQFGHAPVVDVLPAAHRIREVDLPVVAGIHVGERCGDAAFGHHGVRFTEQRLTHQSDRNARGAGFDRGTEAGSAGADNNDIVFVSLVVHVVFRVGLSQPRRGDRW